MQDMHVRQRHLHIEDITIVKPSVLKTAISGTVVGNFIEWYDFGIYGYLAVTMSKVFTGDMPQGLGLLVMLLGFAVSFLVRPVGGMVLGPIGDRIGRRKVLFVTMGMMAVSTGLIGVLPTAAQIGAWAIVPLYLLKMAQGFSAGGEYAGATTYIAEFSPDSKRGFYTAWLDVGSYLGFAFGAATVALTTVVSGHVAGPNAMVNGAWRVPYLLTLPLGIIAIALRARIPETPQFTDQQCRGDAHCADGLATNEDHTGKVSAASASASAWDTPGTMRCVVKHEWRGLLTAVAIVAGTNTAGYLLTSYMPTYLEEEVGTSATMAAVATVPVLVVMSLALPVIGRLSDHIGRRPVYCIGVVLMFLLVYPAFQLLHHGSFWSIQGALVMIAVPVACYLGVSASTLPALFPTASRFSGMAFSYNLAVSLFGGTAPLISQALINLTHNHDMPGFYIMFFSVFTLLAALTMKESAKRPMTGSMPAVETTAEAEALVRTQDENPLIDVSAMPMPMKVVDSDSFEEMRP